jgi:hypothetical protein
VNKLVSKSAQSIRTDSLEVTLTGTNRILVETAAGQKITIQGDANGVLIHDASGDSIQLQGGNIQIRATSQVDIQCSSVNISASMVTVDAPTTQFSGIVKADTVITNTVIANTYTPGAGNVW